MDTRARGARAVVPLLLAAAAAGCTAPSGDEDEPDPEEILPLDLAVDRVDISHGALRLSATMVDGSADVSVRLGDACPGREVGRGMATLSTLVWALDESELADALACHLVVRARVRTPTGHVTKEAPLLVMPDVVAGEESAEQETPPDEVSTGSSLSGVTIVFTSVGPRARLSVGDSLLEPTVGDEQDQEGPTTQFVVPRGDFARAVLLRWPLRLDGASFGTWLSVGGAGLEPDEVEEFEPENVD
jgi:hypothetical protein